MARASENASQTSSSSPQVTAAIAQVEHESLLPPLLLLPLLPPLLLPPLLLLLSPAALATQAEVADDVGVAHEAAAKLPEVGAPEDRTSE